MHFMNLTSWLAKANFPCGTTNQKPDPGRDKSLVWNFFARFSNVIFAGNQ